MAIVNENGIIAVSLPAYQVYQTTNPQTGQPWSDAAQAQAWQDAQEPAFAARLAVQMTVPPAPPPPPPDPRLWWVDPGPFKDRLGMDALAIGASNNDACKACIAMLNGRLYVDLKGAQAASLLDLLIATGQPAANPIFAGSGPMTLAKKAAILNTPTTDAERHIKGLA